MDAATEGHFRIATFQAAKGDDICALTRRDEAAIFETEGFGS
jgi:hypothetical protein